MTQTIEEKDKTTSATPAPDATQSNDVTPDMGGEKRSWGEKHANGVFNFTRSIAINYIANFILAAGLVYAFDTSKYGLKFRNMSGRVSEAVEKASGIPKQFTGFLMNLGLRTQILLCGGHALLLPVTKMKDHQHQWEFRIRHIMDVLQTTVGMDNEATKRSLAQYDHIQELRKANDPNALTADDKKLLKKNHIKNDLTFEDRKQPLGNVIKARLTGMGFTTVVSFLLTLTSFEKVPGWLKFEEKYEIPLGKKFGEKVISRIPGISHLFNAKTVKEDVTNARKAGLIAQGKLKEADDVKHLSGHQLIGICFIDDMIFTAASLIGFTIMERHHDKKIAAEQELIAEAEHGHFPTGVTTPRASHAARIASKNVKPHTASSATERVLETRAAAELSPQM